VAGAHDPSEGQHDRARVTDVAFGMVLIDKWWASTAIGSGREKPAQEQVPSTRLSV
jgi:hypothetical protein